ncbi:hypothetical protein CORC01_07330 [Colletotrichum orchidophilum]|uniref:Uncharacterized protein n=1 Tax=Colletotrichum orchidophilum TaxID=1209926 RepID=A0A1G4B7M5_9PEZI|nr:uncharacterized protein CORC01_07330 [Colletotrichum orchidophilum]OHE97275.1 hypothetical protein CORC01_07330 [Colletotrichum orchidophilum]
MHYQSFKLAAIFAALLPSGLGAVIAPLSEHDIQWETTTEDIDITQQPPFESKPQYRFSDSSGAIEKRSGVGQAVCSKIWWKPQSGEPEDGWYFHEAWCDRSGNKNQNTFRVDCFGGRNDIETLPRRKGSCGIGEYCMDVAKGADIRGNRAHDIACVKKENVHTWVAGALANRVPDSPICSGRWTNGGTVNARATFDVDVLDSDGIHEAISERISFLLNKRPKPIITISISISVISENSLQ